MFESITREVQKGGVKCGVASIAVGCTIDSNRDIAKFGVAYPDIPGSPLALWVEENQEAMQSLERAITAAHLQLVMLRSAKKSGNKEKFADLLKVDLEDGGDGEDDEVEEQDGLGDLTPPIPVLQMTNDQINQYFPKLIKRLLDKIIIIIILILSPSSIIMINRQREHHHLNHHIHHHHHHHHYGHQPTHPSKVALN